MRGLLTLLALLMFGIAGLNVWMLIPPNHGGWFNAVAAAVSLGSGVQGLAVSVMR